MGLPQFTADAALTPSMTHYRGAAAPYHGGMPITPQDAGCFICGLGCALCIVGALISVVAAPELLGLCGVACVSCYEKNCK